MKTGSHKTYHGAGRVSISAGNRGLQAGYRIYKALAPSYDWMRAPKPIYQQHYDALLAALDPRKVWDDIHRMAGDAEPVILCWEVPPFTTSNFCHRRMVADWFQDKLGFEVPEIGETAKLL